MLPLRACLVGLALLGSVARADEGALTIEAGGGFSASIVSAAVESPFRVAVGSSALVTAPALRINIRYAVSHRFELVLGGLYDPEVPVFLRDTTLDSEASSFPGTLAFGYRRIGASFGVRMLFGLVVRPYVGLEVGLVQQTYSGLRHLEVGSGVPRDYLLGLIDAVRFAPAGAIVGGVEWQLGDRFSVSVQPRLEVQLGSPTTPTLTVSAMASWSWFP